MIAATVRSALSRTDEDLALSLLCSGDAERARLAGRVREEGADVLWDDPRLLPALLECRELAAPSAALFYYVAVRRVLLEAGIGEPEVSDYCASLVLAFGLRDRAWRIGEYDENRYAYVVELIEESRRAEGERGFRVQAHLGNFSLWLSGIFPDYIAARRTRKGGPDLSFYEDAGSSGFLAASAHVLAGRYGLNGVLRTAGRRFRDLRLALNRMSDRLFFPNVTSVDRLLRQVGEGPAQ
jgi:hypothetical protein